MKRTFIYVAAVLISAVMQAQDLDPTVEVSRVYEGKLIEVRKPVMEMAIPDTLYRFDLDFDYSVFDNPYRGSYEFNPYMLDMRPESNLRNPSAFYLNAGAGYTLHPVLDVLWSPALKGPFSVDLYGTHRSYVGGYRAVGGNSEFEGYDLLTKMGADFGYDWKKAALDFGASYYGVAVKDLSKTRSYNALDAYLSLKSKNLWPENFMYRIDMAYRYAGDKALLSEHGFSLDGTFGPRLSNGSKMFFDLGVELDSYSGMLDAVMTRFYLVPHYVYSKGCLNLNLGFRLSAAMTSDGFGKNQIIYPDIKMDVALVPEAMRMYLGIGGGEKLNSYASLVDRNHHLDISYAMGSPLALMSPGIERVSAMFGFEGRISGFFSYNLRGGYVNNSYAPLDAAVKESDGRYMPYIGYSPYHKAYAALDWDLSLQSVKFDGTVEYTYAWGFDASYLVRPAALTADAQFVYNWRKRIFAGADCRFSTNRANAEGFEMPMYADLGVYAEYVFVRNMSLWLRGGNLLNMEIQRDLMYAEKGVNVTAGISLTF